MKNIILFLVYDRPWNRISNFDCFLYNSPDFQGFYLRLKVSSKISTPLWSWCNYPGATIFDGNLKPKKSMINRIFVTANDTFAYNATSNTSMAPTTFPEPDNRDVWQLRMREVSACDLLFPITMPRITWNTRITEHYSDVIMGAMASQIISLKIVYSTVYSGAD